jgi:hypothetical protein
VQPSRSPKVDAGDSCAGSTPSGSRLPFLVPIPGGRLVDDQLDQRERLEQLVGNRLTAQDRGSVGAAARRASARSSAPYRSRSRSSRASLVSSATRPSAPSTGSSGRTRRPHRHGREPLLDLADRVGAAPGPTGVRARALSTRAPYPPYRRHPRDRTGSQNQPEFGRASIETWPACCLTVGRRRPSVVSSRPRRRPMIYVHLPGQAGRRHPGPGDRRTDLPSTSRHGHLDVASRIGAGDTTYLAARAVKTIDTRNPPTGQQLTALSQPPQVDRWQAPGRRRHPRNSGRGVGARGCGWVRPTTSAV